MKDITQRKKRVKHGWIGKEQRAFIPYLGTSASKDFTVFNPEAVLTMLLRNFYGDFFT